MTKQKILGSYLLRFTQEKNKANVVCLVDLRTGKQLEFETWVSAWLFLDKELESSLAETYLPHKKEPHLSERINSSAKKGS